jgi:hypothetical protein
LYRKGRFPLTRGRFDPDDSFIQNHLLPALNATETKVFHTGKRIVYSKPMVNWTARTTTNRLVAEIKGMIVKEQDTPKSLVRILVIDSNTRPPVNGKPKVLDVRPSTTRGLEPPKTTPTSDLHWTQRDS